MTEELRAEEYAINTICEACNQCQSKGYIGCDKYRVGKQAYIAGYTEAQNTITQCNRMALRNGIQWHDLRKDPKDLPNDDRIVYVASLSSYEAKENVFDYMFDSWLGDDWFYNAVNDVIAWCENPQFKE